MKYKFISMTSLDEMNSKEYRYNLTGHKLIQITPNLNNSAYILILENQDILIHDSI